MAMFCGATIGIYNLMQSKFNPWIAFDQCAVDFKKKKKSEDIKEESNKTKNETEDKFDNKKNIEQVLYIKKKNFDNQENSIMKLRNEYVLKLQNMRVFNEIGAIKMCSKLISQNHQEEEEEEEND
eukprot:CAMPEP_0114331208 /NCGR_PEP_ID=MMETSP0101-20121206/2254_1 /TAXON_ID=38822 ORGANISM="Pteridomonas danica, Strain PT" /NCGR_SAMPLE_ID=MMETSP0101 /ASSEMBLY_ACC=CAM_ASM_000211 /LENGTH=124 /DNA_ID=CAMNT_0001461455 /DNA_START=387 /DNA_END=758 /DNA_ORIENTATION=+